MAEPSYEELRAQLTLAKKQLKLRERKLRELGAEDPVATAISDEDDVVIKTCQHIRQNGAHCRSAAITGRHYCYFHLSDRGRRLKMARARSRGERWRLELPPLEDLYAVHVSLMQVLEAMSDEHLDARRGGLMLYGLQQAATNLRAPAEVWERSCRFDNVEEVEWPGFEEEHGLPQGFDIETRPEVAFPPLPESEEPLLPSVVGALGETPVTEAGIELAELKARDPELYERRVTQLLHNYRRKLERETQKTEHTRRGLEAARRNAHSQTLDAEMDAVHPVQAPLAATGEVAKKSPSPEGGEKGEKAKDAS